MENGDGTRPRPEKLVESFAGLLREWRELLSRGVDEAEQFTREKPAAGLSAAFFAGLLFGSLLRRR
jgi:ElaB/YqjD/DUF883 family membrane-anchored ribosome-binding protein